MTLGLEHANYSLPEWQVVKLTFLAFLCTLFGEKKIVQNPEPYFINGLTCVVEVACDQAIVFFFPFNFTFIY